MLDWAGRWTMAAPTHAWKMTPKEAVQLQRELAGQVRCEDDLGPVRTIAGVDVSIGRFSDQGYAAIVVLSVPELAIVEVADVGMRIPMPYIPGLLSFREIPLVLDVPSIGCAKSILVGRHEPLPLERGAIAPLRHHDEVVGYAVRTKHRVNPVYVSCGHRVGMETAVGWVLECARGYRLPEPTRQAHLASNVARRRGLEP